MTTEAQAISQQATTPPAVGDYWPGQGGTYMGTMPAIGHLPARHLVFGDEAPKRLTWGAYGTEVEGAGSRIDGAANTTAVLAHKAAHGSDFPAAEWAAAYTADGHTDFHLPSQADLFFASLQPCGLFKKAIYWSSTQGSGDTAFAQFFEHGGSYWYYEGSYFRVRAVRWIPL